MTLDEYLDGLDLRGFAMALLRRPRGRILCCNLVSSVDDGQCSGDFARNVFTWWLDLFRCRTREEARLRPVDAPIRNRELDDLAAEALDALLAGDLPPTFVAGRAVPRFRLCCRRRSQLKSTVDGLANVTAVHSLLFRLIPENERRGLAARGAISLASVHPTMDEEESFFLSGEQTLTLRKDPDGALQRTIGAPGGVVWLTPSAGLARLVKAARAADRLRDVLGLLHHPRGRCLAVLHLDDLAVQRCGTARPTFADAGSHRRFKVRADAERNRQRSAWGHTADLARLASGAPILDGRPERVCGPIPTEDLDSIRVTPLGRTLATRGETSKGANRDDDPAFAAQLVRRQGGRARLVARICAILGI
jgi:hypothetical protein